MRAAKEPPNSPALLLEFKEIDMTSLAHQLRKALKDVTHNHVEVTKDFQVILRRTFFYRHGVDAEMFGEATRKTVEGAKLPEGVRLEFIEAGEVNKPFKGGASVKASSHWWAVFQIRTTL
jgi:endonuclease V-like protein UPF0215 family